MQYIFYVFFALLPFLNYRDFLYAGTSTRTVNLVLISIIVTIIFAIWLFKKGNKLIVPKSPIFGIVSVYLVFLFISASFGLNMNVSFWSLATRTSGLWYFLHLGIFSYILYLTLDTVEKRKKLILVTIISTTIYSLCAFFSAEGINIFFKTYISDAFTFGNSSFAAMYVFGVFLLSIYYVLQSQKRRWWMYLIPPLLLINPNFMNSGILVGNIEQGTTLLGEAKATSVLVVLSILFLMFIWAISKIKDTSRRSKVTYGIFFGAIIIMILSTVSLFSPGGFLRKVYLSQSTAARPIMWEMSANAIKQRPVLGWGTDNFERVFEMNYDSRLLEERYGNEAWFDRAHNVFIDQAVENGLIGLLIYILIYIVVIWCMIRVMLRSTEKNDRTLASILIVYFTLHFVELQTAFDTTISYPMVMLMLVLVVVLYQKNSSKKVEWQIDSWPKYLIASILIIFSLWSLIFGWWPLTRAEFANGSIRKIGNSEGRLSEYPILLSSNIDKHSFLWRMSTDFEIGISKDPKVIEDPKTLLELRKEIEFFQKTYGDYIKENPTHYRSHLNLADMLIYERLLGVDKLGEAQKVLDEAIKLVPQAPQAYWIKAVAYIYMKKFDLAREYAKKGLDINSGAKQSQDVVKYVEESIKNFPEIDLYFFKQI